MSSEEPFSLASLRHRWLSSSSSQHSQVISSTNAVWLRCLLEAGITVGSCLAGSVEVMARATQGTHDATMQLVIVAVLVYTNTLMRVRLLFGVGTLAWSLGAELFLLRSDVASTLRTSAPHIILITVLGLLALRANYSRAREARLVFGKHAEEIDRLGTLAQANEQFAAAALTDSLTGLANRTALDSYFAHIWADPGLSTLAFSAVMVDIDHFKGLNDRYGHLYGDRVLKRVSHLLAEALRGQDDFIARFGGEEFIILLPRTTENLALIVAERLRGLVELAGLPAIRSGDLSLEGMRATISCGVATITPRAILILTP